VCVLLILLRFGKLQQTGFCQTYPEYASRSHPPRSRTKPSLLLSPISAPQAERSERGYLRSHCQLSVSS